MMQLLVNGGEENIAYENIHAKLYKQIFMNLELVCVLVKYEMINNFF